MKELKTRKIGFCCASGVLLITVVAFRGQRVPAMALTNGVNLLKQLSFI
jgi:hypothetical protein